MDENTRTQIVENAADDLLGNQEARLVTRERALHILGTLAQRIAQQTADGVLMSLLTADDVAQQLGVTSRRVRARAAWLNARGHNVGWQITGTSVWLFRPAEVAVLRTERGAGRPRKT